MTSRDFAYWLQGYFEVMASRDVTATHNMKDLNAAQVDVIRAHLALVFKHEIDPSAGSSAHQAELNEIHGQPHRPTIGGVDSHGNVFRC